MSGIDLSKDIFSGVANASANQLQPNSAVRFNQPRRRRYGRTRSGFPAARFYPVNDFGWQSGYPVIYCTFNPSKYSLSITNQFTTKGVDAFQNINMESDEKSMQGRELSMGEIWFDASDATTRYQQYRDVRHITNMFMRLAQMKDPNWRPSPPPEGQEDPPPGQELKPPPVKVAFHWGTFKFLGVIKSLNIEFVLFDKFGNPIRAKADVKLTEFIHGAALRRQNPSSGGGPTERMWQVKAGERLDYIAAEVYGDATRWRVIAARNGIEDPFSLRAGVKLAIPAY